MPRRQSKERKPRRKPGFAHIYPRWSDAQQRWLWRPAIKVDGNHELERLRAADLVETDDGLVLTVHGKTKRVRRVAIPGGFGDLARRALQRAADRPMLAASSISTVCTRWQKRLSEPLLTARNLRRSYATALAECAPLRTVQVQMGHTNLTTTQKYLLAREIP